MITSLITEQILKQGSYKLSSQDFQQGYWGYSTYVPNHSYRICIKSLFPVKTGMRIVYKNPTQKVYFGVLPAINSAAYVQLSGWTPSYDYQRIYNIYNSGFLVIIVESNDNVNITPSDYNCEIEIQSEIFYKQELKENYKDLYKVFQKVGVLGDSLSVGNVDQPYFSRYLEYSWVKKIGQDAGVPWLNFGTSGQNTLTWCSSPTYGLVQMEAQGNLCQAYIIGLGFNDEYNGSFHVDLGTTEDVIDDPDTVATTFYGGYNRIIQLLKRRNPNCKIFCLTSPSGTETTGSSYNEAIRWFTSQHYSAQNNVFLVDLAKRYKDYYIYDVYGNIQDKQTSGVHYSPIGYRLQATLIEKALNEVIQENQSYFRNIPGIAYDITTPTKNTMSDYNNPQQNLIDNLYETVSTFYEADTIPTSQWEQGTMYLSSGTKAPVDESSQRFCRIANYITDIKYIKSIQGNFYVLAYDLNGVYIGAWDPDSKSFKKAYITSMATNFFDATKFSNYQFKLAHSIAGISSLSLEQSSKDIIIYKNSTNDISQLVKTLIYQHATDISSNNLEAGTILNSGSNYTSDYMLRTIDYYENINAIITLNNNTVFLYAYKKIDDSYVGMWNPDLKTFRVTTSYPRISQPQIIDLSPFINDYKFKFVYYRSGSTTTTPTTSEDVINGIKIYKKENKIPSPPPTSGEYILHAVVNNGEISYRWATFAALS